MGWDVGATGLKIVLDSNVPLLVNRYVGEDVRRFLTDHG
jgi:alkylresorcinol/alkylpyrone synthase